MSSRHSCEEWRLSRGRRFKDSGLNRRARVRRIYNVPQKTPLIGVLEENHRLFQVVLSALAIPFLSRHDTPLTRLRRPHPWTRLRLVPGQWLTPPIRPICQISTLLFCCLLSTRLSIIFAFGSPLHSFPFLRPCVVNNSILYVSIFRSLSLFGQCEAFLSFVSTPPQGSSLRRTLLVSSHLTVLTLSSASSFLFLPPSCFSTIELTVFP